MTEFEYKISLGQNFLFDEALIARLLDETDIETEDTVLEIGAGRGDLTLALAKRCKHVVTVEIDERLAPVLKEQFQERDNITLVMGDVMTLDLKALMAPYGAFHVAANLPYYLTTPILTLLFKLPLPILSANVMVQQEAAARVMAMPGTREYGPLALLARYRGEPKDAVTVPARVFTPPPKVDSVFMVMPFFKSPPLAIQDDEFFFRLIYAAFAMRRKTLVNNLMPFFAIGRTQAQEILMKAGIPINARGEAVTLAQFSALSDILHAHTQS